MAKLGNIHILADGYFKDTRVKVCYNKECRYLFRDYNCNFRTINLDENGKCSYFEPLKEKGE